MTSCCFLEDNCLKCGKRKAEDDDSANQHPASWIVVAWQSGYAKEWRWNNAHRHLSTDPRVPLWDDRGCLFAKCRRPKIPWIISVQYTDVERAAIHRIRLIRYNMNLAEVQRLKMKKVWWRRNVENKFGYFQEYEEYKRERMVPGLWLSLAMDRGLTFRHLRTCGYRPYIDLACALEDETDAIDTRVIIASQAFPNVRKFANRPYIFVS